MRIVVGGLPVGSRRQANGFGTILTRCGRVEASMEDVEAFLEDIDGPAACEYEYLDARELPPPEPLQRTLEQVTELGDETVFVQRNDRMPTFLYPKLDDRGYSYETREVDDAVLTAIWRPNA